MAAANGDSDAIKVLLKADGPAGFDMAALFRRTVDITDEVREGRE